MLVPINRSYCSITPGSHLLNAIYIGQSTPLIGYPNFRASKKQYMAIKISQQKTFFLLNPIQHTEDTKDVPSGKRRWHRPMGLEYARHWNMRQPGSGTSWHLFMQCRSLDTTVGKS